MLRFPGSKNYDYANVYRSVPTVRTVKASGAHHAPEQLGSLLPSLTDNPGCYVLMEDTGRWAPSPSVAGADMERHLTRYGRRVFRGEFTVSKLDGEIDRSESLYKIACVLCDALRRHYREDEVMEMVVDALEERDASLGWDKYTGRPSQYRRIVAKKLQSDKDR